MLDPEPLTRTANHGMLYPHPLTRISNQNSKGSLGRRECPFCREAWTATAVFRRPGAEDVSDDEDEG